MKISVVIVSYNSEKFLKKNIDSLLEQTIEFNEIIVVDNHSCDGSLEILGRYPKVCKIALDYNSGYARGANIGILNSNSDLLLIANSDIILEKTFNEKVLDKFANDAGLAMLSPLILRFDGKTVDSAGQSCSRALHPRETGFNKPVEKVKIKEGTIFSVCGAATVFRRTALEKLKIENEYYDEDFFIFWEDFDIGWRANLLGLKTVFYPEALVHHYRSGTLKKNVLSRFSLALARSASIKYHLVKNRYLTLIKNFRLRQNVCAIPFIFFKDIVWVSLLTISSPKIIIELMKSGKYIKKALKKRKIINIKMN